MAQLFGIMSRHPDRTATLFKQITDDPDNKISYADQSGIVLLGYSQVTQTQEHNPVHAHASQSIAQVAIGVPSQAASWNLTPIEFARQHNTANVWIRWDEASQLLFAARDPLNQYTLYYAESEDYAVVASEAQWIARFFHTPMHLNRDALACWLGGVPNPYLSLFTNIHIVPSANLLSISPHRPIKLERFWHIDPNERMTGLTDDEYEHAFLATLKDSVTSHIPSDHSVIASQMSGGMDSTSITTLANHVMQQRSGRCIPLSHHYRNSSACDESDLINTMLNHLNLRDAISLNVDEGANRDFFALYPTDFDSPGIVLSPRYHAEMSILQERGIHLMLTGNGGDEMCWGHSLAYTQRLKQGDLSVIPEVITACRKTAQPVWPALRHLFVRPLIPELLLRLLRPKHHNISGALISLPDWLSDEARERAIDASRIDNPFNAQTDPVGYARYHSLMTTSTYNSMRSYQKVAGQYGIAVAHPFFGSEVVKQSFALPAQQLINHEYPKSLLRRAMQHLMPSEVVWKQTKVTFDQHFGQLIKDNHDPLRALLSDTTLEDMGLLDTQRLLQQFDQTVNRETSHVHVDLLYAILTQRWLQQHRNRFSL